MINGLKANFVILFISNKNLDTMETKKNDRQADHTAKETVLTFLNALNHEDFETARKCLNGDMTFDGVMGHREGAESYISDMKKMKFKYEILKSFEEGRDVCVLYNIDMGKKAAIYTCGWYQVVNGKIRQLKVVFDPRPLLEKQDNN